METVLPRSSVTILSIPEGRRSSVGWFEGTNCVRARRRWFSSIGGSISLGFFRVDSSPEVLSLSFLHSDMSSIGRSSTECDSALRCAVASIANIKSCLRPRAISSTRALSEARWAWTHHDRDSADAWRSAS